MAYRTDPRLAAANVAVDRIDAGLRSFMLGVYNYMGIGLAITGLVAFAVAMTPAIYGPIFGSPLKWVVMLAPLGFVFFLGARVNSMSKSATQLTFWLFCGVMGLSLSSIFLVFTGESVARVFFITAATFGAVSLYGYTTKTDLSKMGSFMMMGLIGIVIASVVNIFIGSSALQFAVSIIGVVVFTGLTAWDTQRLKEEYLSASYDGDVAAKAAIMGALGLYLNFINLFTMLLQLLGVARSQD